VTKDNNSNLVTDRIEKAKSLNSYYGPLFFCERNNPKIQSWQSGKPFTFGINIISKRLSAIGRKKSDGPVGIPGEILKLIGEAMIPFFARLLDITTKNNVVPLDLKRV